MEIAVIGISHKEAPVQIRGEVAFTTSMKMACTKELFTGGLKEFMIISTCNRSEIYIATKDMSKDVECVKQYYKQLAGDMIEPYLFVKKYEVALQHIFQVATGLNSLIIGEDEILGQMKRALDFGLEQKSCKKHLTKVVREAITFSKKTRHANNLSQNQLSVASIGIKYLKERLGSLKDKKVLLIGTGAMGQLVLRYLEAENIETIYLTNRTYNKDKIDFHIDSSIRQIDYEERYERLKEMDIVISATASPHTIISKERIKPFEKPITFLDMAVPRDIDSRIDSLPNAHVVTLDDFDAIAKEHLNLRKAVAQHINRLILEEVRVLELWLLRTKVDGVIKELHMKQDSVVNQSLKLLKETMSLSDFQETVLEEVLRKSTWAMIKEPINELKSLEARDDIDQYKLIVERLFNFEEGKDE